ncbi:hypothetical protein [Actinomadura rugatobispora]|uniref:Guanylate cyclase domain-containing protein n=1 Tax=Actinomadura rugatobispora TaxID=1994 RepID=A0ABW1A8D7_9ACTN|nr:hypothetical protein GCM10010200_079050 [Actinomadura rugatobispora]
MGSDNLPAVRRTSLVVDLEGYSKRSAPGQVDAQGRLLWSMVHALKAAGIAPDSCARQDQGDGQLITLPPGINEARVLPTVILALNAAMSRVNSLPGEAGRLRLRMGMAQGPVQLASIGYVGAGVVAACRMVDSAPPRQALKRHRDADMAAIVSDDLYRQVFSQGYDVRLAARDFQPVQVVMSAKGYQADAWLHVPAVRPVAGLVPDFTGAYEDRSGAPWLAMIPLAAAGVGVWWWLGHEDDPADQGGHRAHPDHVDPRDPVDPTPDWQHDPVRGWEYDPMRGWHEVPHGLPASYGALEPAPEPDLADQDYGDDQVDDSGFDQDI